MRGSTLLLLACAFPALTVTQPPCECDLRAELERERKEDKDSHECRACKMIELNDDGNCPQMGYECDANLDLNSDALVAGSCKCANLRCAAKNATLAVGGELVQKLLCNNLKWKTPSGDEAISAVCARKCGLGICPQLPRDVFEGQDIIGPLVISPPDLEHPCAWGECKIGAISTDGTTDFISKGISSFACSSDRTWRYTGPATERRHLLKVACVIKDCKTLPFASSNTVCQTKYLCYPPSMDEGEGDDWKKMSCPEPKALRRNDDGQEIAATCKIGQWSADITPIDSNTEVMCVTCRKPDTVVEDTEQPKISEKNKAVTCDKGKLTVEFQSSSETKHTEVTTLTCSEEFHWTSTGGNFAPFASLEDVINQGATWRVRCVTDTDKPCNPLSTIDDAPYCYIEATRPKGKYWCNQMEPLFIPTRNAMTCLRPIHLRYANDVDKVILPTCVNGQWSDGTTTIPDTTKVVCITCKWVTYIEKDAEIWHYNDVKDQTEVLCPSKPLVIQLFKDQTAIRKIPVTSIKCNPTTIEWESEGADLSPYTSLSDVVEQGVQWAARCLNPGE